MAGGGRFSGGEVNAGRGQAHRYGEEAGRTLPSWTSPRACHHHLRTACSQRRPADPALCRISAKAPSIEPLRKAEECWRLWRWSGTPKGSPSRVREKFVT